MLKKSLKFVLYCLILGGIGYGIHWYRNRPRPVEPTYYRSQVIQRGSLTQEVTATGTIAPIKEVSVTTQVTGKIISLSADYNSRIVKDQVIALIDPDTYESALASARAQLKNNEASRERTQAQLTLAGKELERLKKLYAKEMATESELDNAQASYDELVATLKSNEASIEQSQASVRTAEKNLADCTITSPVTGIVIDRSVEEGQTVVSSMNATGLFNVATELTRVQVEAAIPEADVGSIRVGQRVVFTVDAYKEKFQGKVTQIRLASETTSNVVTYPVIIEAENPEEKLFPGMTANLSIIVEEARDVVLVPNAATRFTPPEGSLPSPPTGAHPKEHQPLQTDATHPKGTGEQKTFLWLADSPTQLHPVPVELGITDGVNTVVLQGGDALVGQKVAVGKMSAAAAKQAASEQPSNPFMPKPPSRNGRQGGGPGGPPPGGPR